MSLPVGTVTFLRSDIEGSMDLVRALGARYDEANAEHAAIVRAAVAAHAGEVIRTEGDAFFIVFTDAGQAARAAIDVQRVLATHPWPEGHRLKVRMGIHTGVAVRAGDDYGGFEVSRAARIGTAGHGGQIVVSETAAALIALDLPAAATLHDLGAHRLRGVPDSVHLHQLDAPGLERDFPPLRTGRDPAEHLPERMTTLVGRTRELEELGSLLGQSRLLTLTGPGGTGKTTLAIELARLHAEEYADGAWFVDLQAVHELEAARAQLARDLGVFDGPAGPAVERLVPYVAGRELLVVLDNLEQVRGAADLVGELVRASRPSRFIATSRTPLRLAAEQEFAVRPLATTREDDGDEPAAVRLFLERVRKYRPELRLGDEELGMAERICRLVDGLPLAVELCAARVAVLPVGRIAERLAQQLPLPGSGPRDLPARQRTLEDTVAWSFELLEPPLQQLFLQLGVFDGPFELEQAEIVCQQADGTGLDVLEGLASLVEQSLLIRQDDAIGGVRFRLLETMRAFSRTRLAKTEEMECLRALHARAYLALVERLFPNHADTADGRVWLDRLEADDDNLRQAVSWAIDAGQVEVALGLVGYLWRYWVHSGRVAEGHLSTGAALDLPGADAPTEARVWAISAAGSVAYWSNDIERAVACYEEQLTLASSLGVAYAEADAWFNLVYTRVSSGDEAGAEEAFESARGILTELGEERVLEDAMASLMVMRAMMALNDPVSQQPVLGEQIAVMERSKSPAVQVALPDLRAIHALAGGDVDAAVRYVATGLRVALTWRRHGDVIAGLGLVAAIAADKMAEVSATLMGALETAGERFGVSGPPWPAMLDSPLIPADPHAVLEAQLGADGLEEALQRGRHMSLHEAVGYLEHLASGMAIEQS